MTQSFLITLLSGLKTLLETITVANGYNTDVALVDYDFKTPDQVSSKQLPALLIVPGTIDIQETGNRQAEGSFTISLFGYVMDNTAPTEKMLKLQQDVIACLAGEENRIAGCSYIKPRRVEMSASVFSIFGYQGGVAAPYAAFRIDLEAYYSFSMVNGG